MVDGAGIGDEVSARIARSIYEGNTPETLSEEMRKLLRRVRAELARENENLYDIKFGYGGEMELDYIIQYFQLLNGASFTELGSGNSWKALERLRDLKLIEDAEYRDLYESLLLYRKISSRLRIYQDRPENMVKLDADFMEKLARKVNLPGIDSGEKLKEVIDSARKKVHTIFMKYIGE
jgi:glutamate-ammonia-ligase adenylyltransferase